MEVGEGGGGGGGGGGFGGVIATMKAINVIIRKITSKTEITRSP